MLRTERPIPPASAAEPEIALEEPGFFSSWTNFWFAPADPVGLHWLRFLAGALFIYWLLPLAGHVDGLFGLEGWFGREAFIETSRLRGGEEDPGITFGWSLLFLCGDNSTLLHLAFWGAIAVFALFALGIATRITGVLTWALVGSFLISPASSFDADYLLVIPALYLMLGYLLLGQWSRNLTPLERILGPRGTSLFALFRADREAPTPSHAANLAMRLLQVHFAFVVVTSVLHKLQSGAWWSGVAFWYPLTPPGTAIEVLQRRADSDSFLILISLSQYIVLAWQLGFPLFAWRRGMWRVVLIGGAVVGWIGSAGLFGLPLFGPIYLLCCLSYLTPEEWSRIAAAASAIGRRDRQEFPERTEKKTVKQPASTHVTR